jgi:iron complex transport system permease protein
MNGPKRRLLFMIGLAVACLAGFHLSMVLGPVHTTAGDLLRFVLGSDSSHSAVFLDFRLARAVLAFLVGAALALSGAILQGYFQNPMADPFVVGVSSGASFGAVLFSATGLGVGVLGVFGQSLSAFAGGLGVVFLVYFLSLRKGAFKIETLLLTGLAAGAMTSAMTSFLLFMRADSYDQAVFWLLGSFQLAAWTEVKAVVIPVAACLAAAIYFARDMDLLSLGDETASSLGCPVAATRKIFLALATLLAAVSVSVAGVIGFAGLIVPHAVRLVAGPGHRRLFILSSLVGGTFLLYCDLLARTLLPAELPVGGITAAFGAPFFIYLLHRKR